MFLLVSVRHVGAHPGGHQHGVSIQISINLGKTFFWISHIRKLIFFWPESWRGALYIYLPLFPRFRNLSIEWFWLLFWSILNDVTLKTSNWLLVYILWYHQFLIFQFCDVSLNNFLILCVWNKLASWTKGPCLQQGGKMKNFCLEQGQGLKASMAYHYPNFLSPGDFIRLQFLWEKLIKGLPLL